MFAKKLNRPQKSFNFGEMSTEDESKSRMQWSGERKDSNLQSKFPQFQAFRIRQSQPRSEKKRVSTQQKSPIKISKRERISVPHNRVKSQNHPIQENKNRQTNLEDQDFEKFYSIGKIYWNINEQKLKQQKFDQLPYIKKTEDKYLFNTKYFFPKRKTENDREQLKFNKLRKKCIDIYTNSQRKQSKYFDHYDQIVEKSLKKSIRNLKHFDDGDYTNRVVDQIYHDEYQNINQQLKMIHRIKQRHNIIQRIKDQRKKLIDKFNSHNTEVKLQPYV